MQSSGLLARRALSTALLICLAGCGSGPTDVPSSQTSRQALDTALTAWTHGEKPGAMAGTKPAVTVHDTPWSQGQRLASYEILKEEQDAGASASAEKRFTVRLSLAEPNRTEEVRYHVLGVDPVMVFRDEDYLRNINMENGPSTLKTPTKGRKTR